MNNQPRRPLGIMVPQTSTTTGLGIMRPQTSTTTGLGIMRPQTSSTTLMTNAVMIQPVAINYVISAHGAFLGTSFDLPHDVEIQFYSCPGESLNIGRSFQTKVCQGRIPQNPLYRHRGKCGEYVLTADRKPRSDPDSFLSGIKDCNNDEIVFDLTAHDRHFMRFGFNPNVTLSEMVARIVTYHRNTYENNPPVVIHFLACRDVDPASEAMINVRTGLPAYGGKRKKTRRSKRKSTTRRRY